MPSTIAFGLASTNHARIEDRIERSPSLTGSSVTGGAGLIRQGNHQPEDDMAIETDIDETWVREAPVRKLLKTYGVLVQRGPGEEGYSPGYTNMIVSELEKRCGEPPYDDRLQRVEEENEKMRGLLRELKKGFCIIHQEVDGNGRLYEADRQAREAVKRIDTLLAELEPDDDLAR